MGDLFANSHNVRALFFHAEGKDKERAWSIEFMPFILSLIPLVQLHVGEHMKFHVQTSLDQNHQDIIFFKVDCWFNLLNWLKYMAGSDL